MQNDPIGSRQLAAKSASGMVGRPRRFDAATERRMIMDAAFRIMARSGYVDASVGDILAEAGLSTRAFYRHFDSKSALLLTLFRRDAEAVGRSLRAAVQDARDPRQGLEAWLDGYLDVFYEPRRAARTALFTSPGVRATEGYGEELARTRQLHVEPLIDVLRAGHRRGVLRSRRPTTDAQTILAVVGSVCDPLDERFSERHDARAHVERFCWPALGLEPNRGRSPRPSP